MAVSDRVMPPRNGGDDAFRSSSPSAFPGGIPRRPAMAVLAAIIVVGVAMRFVDLGAKSLWNDELSTWNRANFATPAEVVEFCIRDDVHPPGYLLLMWAVERTIGTSEYALRLPSAIAGVVVIPVLFLIGRRLFGTFEGLAAAAFVATFRNPLYRSQDARSYAILALFAVVATYLLVLLFERLRRDERPPMGLIAAYIATAVSLAYVHYFGLLLVALHGIAAAVATFPARRWRIAFVLAGLAIVAAYVPWLAVMREQFSRGPIWISPPPALPIAFGEFLGSLSSKSYGLLALVVAIYALYGYVLVRRAMRGCGGFRRALAGPDALVVAWLVVPFLAAWAISVAIVPVLSYRNLAISMPAAYLLLARGIAIAPWPARLGRREVVATIVALAVVVAFIGHLVFRERYYTNAPKQEIREAVYYVADRDPGARDAVVGCTFFPSYLNYYFAHTGMPGRVRSIAGDAGEEGVVRREMEAGNGRLWYVVAQRLPDPAFVAALDREFRVVERRAFVGVDVTLYADRRGSAR